MSSFIMIAIGIWLTVIVGWYVVTKLLKDKGVDQIQSRLGGKEVKAKVRTRDNRPSLIGAAGGEGGVLALRILERWDLQPRLQTLLEQAGVRWGVARLVHACLGFFIIGYLLVHFFLPPKYRVLGLLPAAAIGMLPVYYIFTRRKKRMRRFEELFPDTLEFVSRSMRAGHAFSGSLEMIHREFQEPIAGEFKRAFEEHNLGLPLDVALEKLAKRVPLLDVQFFVSAVSLQKRTGGNLAEILDKLAFIIRERFKLLGKIRAVAAHGKMTGMALSSVPILVGAMMCFTNRDYVFFFIYDDVGNVLIGTAFALQLLGYWIIQQIVKIEV
jgi:tight adherence protein B